jgi:hypothetical protein
MINKTEVEEVERKKRRSQSGVKTEFTQKFKFTFTSRSELELNHGQDLVQVNSIHIGILPRIHRP